MPRASIRLQRLASRLLALESSSAKGRATADSAVFQVCEKLRQPLAVLSGKAGFRSLLSRALAIAGEDVAWLKGIHVNASGSLEGLEAPAQIPADEIAEGEALLVAELIGLLVTFIGEALTAHLLQEIWPEVSARDLSSAMEKDNGKKA